MRTWLKVTIGIIVSLIIIFIVGGYILYNSLLESLPIYQGELKAPSLKSEVKIYFDSLAVPYIVANTDEDVSFTLGYLHASERIFSMDMMRRAGEGRLSEIFGVETLPFDKMFRTVGLGRTAKMIKEKMNPEGLKLLEAYSRGVNFYIEEKKNDYPVEFDVLGYQPEEWKPEHSIIVIRMMAWELNLGWWTDLTFTELVQKLGEEKVKEILPGYPENAPTIIPSDIKKFSQINSNFIETDKAFRKFIGMTGTHLGSNNWVVNSQMSASGKPIIANDPHLAYRAPGIWYAAVIKSPNLPDGKAGWNAAGVTLPGVPGIVIGKNENISWTLTNIMTDETDFYFETLDSSRTKYLLDGKWIDLNIIQDTIETRDGIREPIEIKYTHRGPIISNIHPYTFVFNKDESTYPPISMRWLGNEFSDEMDAFLKINKAKNWNEFKSAVEKFNTPGQNFVYADREGNIGYIFGGALPIRPNNATTFVFDGSTAKNDWKGFVPRNELPYLFNPSANLPTGQAGFIATANNKVMKDFKYHITNLWEPSSRIERITELLQSKQKHSVEDYMKYQEDILSPYAKQIVPYILFAFQDVEVKDKNLSRALQLLEEWNYEMDKYQQAPAIFLTFFDKLMKNIYMDEMGEDLFNQYVFLANVPYRNIPELLQNPFSDWFNDVKKNERKTRDDVIRESMNDALDELENKLGKEVKFWQWGNLHTVTFKHAFAGVSWILDEVINIGPYEISGDGTTIFNTEYSFSESIEKYPLFRHEPFDCELGPSMRFIYDFAKPDEFYLILTTGQSGNIFSDHYKDQTELFLNGKYMKIRTDEASITNQQNSLLRLLPK
ncbi:MAG: penicillin acylase family protein [Ignavibacteriaceae bacterium]|nr:penicillin acylase family protein [Ignavibacteriaceae bacterium]